MPIADPVDPFVIKDRFDRLVGWPLGTSMPRAWLRAARAARRVWAPMPWERRRASRAPAASGVLQPFERLDTDNLRGRKVGLVVSGGSGNLSTTCGVVRAIEEAGGTIVAVSGCSGGSMWAAMVALGLDSDAMVELSMGRLDPRRYLDLQPVRTAWRSLRAGRAFTGVMPGVAAQELFDELAQRRRLADLPVPFYSILWELETNRVVYAGTKTTPDWTLGEAVRGSLCLSPMVEPMRRDGRSYLDGGVVNVFSTAPLVEHHPEVEVFVAINGFLPHGFTGPDLTGWGDHRLGLLRAARQLQLAAYQELARRDWEAIADRAWLVEPIDDEAAYGVNFFAAMIDRSVWPERIRAGHAEARRVLVCPPGTRSADLT